MDTIPLMIMEEEVLILDQLIMVAQGQVLVTLVTERDHQLVVLELEAHQDIVVEALTVEVEIVSQVEAQVEAQVGVL